MSVIHDLWWFFLKRLLHDEMGLREADLDAFEKTGLTLIKNGHFMSEDITEKIATLNSR